MHDLREGNERLDVVPVTDIVAVKVQEFQLSESSEDLGWRKRRDRVVRQVKLLQLREALQVHEVALLEEVALQVSNSQVLAA